MALIYTNMIYKRAYTTHSNGTRLQKMLHRLCISRHSSLRIWPLFFFHRYCFTLNRTTLLFPADWRELGTEIGENQKKNSCFAKQRKLLT